MEIQNLKKRKLEILQPEIIQTPSKKICQDTTSGNWDDANNHYIINLGSNLTQRCKKTWKLSSYLMFFN